MVDRVLDTSDLSNLEVGGSVISCSGGGPSTTGSPPPPLDAATAAPRLRPVADLQDDDFVVMMGAIGGGVSLHESRRWLSLLHQSPDATALQTKRIEMLAPRDPVPTWASWPQSTWVQTGLVRLGELVGKAPAAFLISETGPLAAEAVVFASSADQVVLDADTTGGRPVPEMSFNLLNVNGVPLVPVVFVNQWGDRLVFEELLNMQRLEDMSRALATASGGTGLLLVGLTGAQVKSGDAAYPGTLSRTMAIGKAANEATKAGSDPVSAALEAAGGRVIFSGHLESHTTEERGAFTSGRTIISGDEEWDGHWLRIWFQNENLVSWLDDAPYVAAPDLITVLDPATGLALSNFAGSDWPRGREVVVAGIPCAPFWRQEPGRDIFNPARWGFGVGFEPVSANP